MTCEIALMNREAIALAADSAETVFGRKIFPSAEKLFALTRSQPMGIMIYGDADISGVPWETVIKRYRDKLGMRTFDNLNKYGENFISFLESNEYGLIPDQAQESYMSNKITECFDSIVEDISVVMKALFQRKGNLTEEILKAITKTVVNRYCDAINSVDMYPSIPGDYPDKIRSQFRGNKDEYTEIFENLPIQGVEDKIEEIAVNIFTHNIRGIKSSGIAFFDEYEPKYSSGIVIAGFGEKDTFPSIVTYEIEGMLFNHLKYVHLQGKSKTIGIEKYSAEIIPFAQTDMVEQFLWGIDSSLETYISNVSMKLFSEACYSTIKHDRKLNEDDKERIHKKFSRKLRNIHKQHQDKSWDFQFTRHYGPTLKVLSILPKDELAMMAETLINLTSFKRRVSTARETVSGPIDVAIISRGDGFVWIKRKRYFPSELNPNCT